jgi:hypothetical protein
MDGTSLDRSELRQATAQELESFARQLKAIASSLERLSGGIGEPQRAVIDSELAKLDEHLRFALRQFDVGLLDIGVSAKATAAIDPEPIDAAAGLGSTPPHFVELPAEPRRPTPSTSGARGTHENTRASPISWPSIAVVPTRYPDDPSGAVIVENYIAINLDGIAAREFFGRLDELLSEISRSNQISGELRDQLKHEIAAGKSVMSAPKANRKLIDLLLVRPLTWLAEKTGSAIIGKLATDGLDLLLRLLNN